MFTVNDDKSIYATRGDVVFFTVSADDNGTPYKFQPGDIVRMSIYGKKDAATCVMQKDFPVAEVCESVFISLDEHDTKLGESISKQKDYWYEVVLNPDTMPQTIIGYDEDGAKIFRLFPESEEIEDNYEPKEEDFPVVDSEFDMTSPRPVANHVVARAVAQILDTCERTNMSVLEKFATPQMYGAVGDGVADDTEAFEQAIEENKRLFVPAGNYRITDLVLGDCEIFGVNGTNINVAGTIRITNTYYPRIRNLRLTAVGEAREALVVIDTSYYGVFESVQFSNYSGAVNVGVHVDGSDFCYYQAFRSCVFNNLPVGIKFSGHSNAHLVDKCEFYECETCASIDGAENIRLTNNCFQSFTVCGVKIDVTGKGLPKSTLIMGNYFEADEKTKDTTYVGDIDFSNNEACQGNFVLANHYTFTKTHSHVVNMVSQNMILDYYVGQESSVPNTLMGLTALEVMTDAHKQYSGERFAGTIMPVEEESGVIRYYVYGKVQDGRMGWQRLLTTGLSENDTVALPVISTAGLSQFYKGYVQLGYDYDGTADRAITFDSSHKLLKMYNGGKWEYYQKVVSGTTAERPTWKPRGYQYFDATLGKPIFSTGNNTWVDATGAEV